MFLEYQSMIIKTFKQQNTHIKKKEREREVRGEKKENTSQKKKRGPVRWLSRWRNLSLMSRACQTVLTPFSPPPDTDRQADKEKPDNIISSPLLCTYLIYDFKLPLNRITIFSVILQKSSIKYQRAHTVLMWEHLRVKFATFKCETRTFNNSQEKTAADVTRDYILKNKRQHIKRKNKGTVYGFKKGKGE